MIPLTSYIISLLSPPAGHHSSHVLHHFIIPLILSFLYHSSLISIIPLASPSFLSHLHHSAIIVCLISIIPLLSPPRFLLFCPWFLSSPSFLYHSCLISIISSLNSSIISFHSSLMSSIIPLLSSSSFLYLHHSQFFCFGSFLFSTHNCLHSCLVNWEKK